MVDTASITARPVRLAPCYRIVASRMPTIYLFERVAPAEDWAELNELESLTNPRIRNEKGELRLVAAEDRVTGPNASIVMAPFTHLGRPSRFSDGSYGVYYAARSLETAVRETAFHRGRFLAATSEPPCEVDMRAYVGRPVKPFLDIRAARYEALHHPDDYATPQKFAQPLRDKGHWGLVYRSVRHVGGECIAAFKPQAVSIPTAGAALAYVWDGELVNKVYEKSEVLFAL